jgi:hypothetical protein
MKQREILFEGLSEDEILQLPNRDVEELILIGEPIVFRAGSATILGSFKLEPDRLIIELAQIDRGGEGILVALGSLARRFAILRRLKEIEWIVHAVDCANPNLKLRRVLERRGFQIKQLSQVGAVYHLLDSNI